MVGIGHGRHTMNRTGQKLLIVLMAVMTLSGETVMAQDSESADESQSSNLESRTGELEDELASLKSLMTRIATWGSILVIAAGFFGYSVLREAMRRVVERRLETETNKAVGEHLPRLLEDVGRKAEGDLLRLAQLLALRSSGNYDEALEAFAWQGGVPALRTESAAVRRAVIDSLWGARKNRATNRREAWDAVTELVQDDVTPDSVALFLRLSISHRRYQDGIDLVERHEEVVRSSRETALRAATLFRQVGKLEDAKEFALPHADPEDLRSLVTLNSIQRDLGNFDEVHDSLRPAVERLTKSPSTILPEGWHRILNTFVANCLDRGRPEDGVTAAEFVMRSAPGPVEVFTAGRLVLALPKGHSKRVSLQAAFEAAIPSIHPEAEAATRCEALLARLKSDNPRAEQIIQQAIEQAEKLDDPQALRAVYYHRSALAELLLERGAHQEAIDELTPAVGHAFGGEAKFNLACAYALAGEAGDAARWLREAIREAPKWAARARDHDALRSHAEITEVLAAASTSL